MKHFLLAILLGTASVAVLADDVGVSVSVGQPGFYGRIDIGGYSRPQVIYRQPIMVRRVPVSRPPVYLHVPPEHSRNWRRHCDEYNACGERVMFVRDNWYRQSYVPRYQERQRDRHRDPRGKRKDDDRRWENNGTHGRGR